MSAAQAITVLTASAVMERLVDLGVESGRIHLADASYALPSRDWLLGPFFRWHARWLRRHGLARWQTYWDCDDFSRHFAHAAQVSHKRRVPRHAPADWPEGIAVYEHWYIDPRYGPHAQILALTTSGTLCLEPQPEADDHPVRDMTAHDWARTLFIR